MKLEVTREKGHNKRVDGVVQHFAKGDTFNGTERELAAFADRLKKSSQQESQNDPVPDADVQAVLDANSDEAVDMLPSLTDEQLDELRGLETRKGVSKAAVEERERREAGE